MLAEVGVNAVESGRPNGHCCSSSMWQSFLGGAAWAVALTGRGEPVHCHCTCECQPVDCGHSVWLELLKGLVWISIALLFYTQRVIGWLWERQWPCVAAGGPSHERSVVGEAAEVTHGFPETSNQLVEQRAKEQLNALRRKHSTKHQ